jgi:hypothetical protein
VRQRNEFGVRLYKEEIPAVVTTPTPAADKNIGECNIIE